MQLTIGLGRSEEYSVCVLGWGLRVNICAESVDFLYRKERLVFVQEAGPGGR